MRISIWTADAPNRAHDFDVSGFVPTTYRLRFRFDDDDAAERLHVALGGAGYSSRVFVLSTEDGEVFHGRSIDPRAATRLDWISRIRVVEGR